MLILAAHFFRASLVPLAAICLSLVGLLFVRTPWAARCLQVALLAGTLEWLRTAWLFASARALSGEPYGRLLVILGAVAAATAASAVLPQHSALRRYFRFG